MTAQPYTYFPTPTGNSAWWTPISGDWGAWYCGGCLTRGDGIRQAAQDHANQCATHR